MPDEENPPDDANNGCNSEDDCPVSDKGWQGHPISIYNGNSFETATDIYFPSPFQGGFTYKRKYNSRFDETDLAQFNRHTYAYEPRYGNSLTAYGYGWTHTFNEGVAYWGYWWIPSDQPLAMCDPDFFNGSSYTYRWMRVQDETGRGTYFFSLSGCTSTGNSEYKGVLGERGTLSLTDNYEWHRSDGSVHIYSTTSKHLIEKIDPNGNRQILTYDDNDRLYTVTDQATGKVLTFYYNAEGLLDHITGPVTDAVPDGVWVSYGYDDERNLTSVTYPDGSGRIYQYEDPNDPHNLTAELDQDENFIFGWTYDDQDRGTSNTTNDNRSVTIDYINDTTIVVTNAYNVTSTFTLGTVDGRKRITAIDAPADCPGCAEDTTGYVYNDQGKPEEVTYVNGRVDRYENYDSNKNPRTEIIDYGGPDQITVETQYHPVLRVPIYRTRASVIGTGSKETIWDFDDDGNDTPNESPTTLVRRIIERGYTLDDQGQVVSYEYITTLDYNTKGQVTQINGPRPGDADITSFVYDPDTGDLESMTQPHVGTTYFTEYDDAGNPTRMVDPNGIETILTYDARNRVHTTTRNGATTTTEYTLRGKPDFITDAVGRTLNFQYDTKAFLKRIKDPADNYQYFAYNAIGQPEQETTYTAADIPTRTLRFDYGDPLTNPDLMAGKPWKAIRPTHDGSGELETVFGYDTMGNVASVTDARTNTTTYRYDAHNRLECIEQPGNAVIEYDYDTQGNLISVLDPEGVQTFYLYDDMGRLVEIDSPDAGVTTFAYDEAGNQTRKTHNSLITDYAYDYLNRLLDITYADGSPGVSYTYDTGSGNHLAGRLAAVYDESGERHFSYDANGNLDYEERIIDGVSYVTDYLFDAAGNLRTMAYPTGQVVQYQPDTVDPALISAVRLDNGSTVTTIADTMAYKPFGPQTHMTLGNAIQQVKSFDLNYQIDTLTTGTVINLDFTPDPAGNIQQITNNLDATRSQTFGYDARNQLTSATGIYGSIGFTYDRTGNRQTRTVNSAVDTYTYIPGTNRLDTITGTQAINFNHDSRGNLVGRSYMDTPGPAIATPDYTYTHDGQRISKTVSDQTTIYHYDITGQLIAETDAAGNMVKAYVWLHGQPLAMIDGAGAVYYYHNDHLGTPQKMTDAGGAVVWAADYLPFGGADVRVAGVVNHLRFAGQYYDNETGLHYNYHRYYDPSLGRYLRADPIGLLGGVNPYVYSYNSPIVFIDPYGLTGLEATIGGGSAYIAGGGSLAGVTSAAAWVAGPAVSGAFGYFGTQWLMDNYWPWLGNGGIGGWFYDLTHNADSGDSGTNDDSSPNITPGGACPNGDDDPGDDDHFRDRRNQGQQGDPNRQIGDHNRTIQQGRKFLDNDTGNTVYVRGNKVVVTDPKGNPITQFKNPRANTLMRIRNGRWTPID